jgi:hypothetical protein
MSVSKRERTYQLRYCTRTGEPMFANDPDGPRHYEQVALREIVMPEDCSDREAWIASEITDLTGVPAESLDFRTDAISKSIMVRLSQQTHGPLVWVTERKYQKLPRSYCLHASDVVR